MSTGNAEKIGIPLPQTGWTTDAHWCAALGLEQESFRKLVKRYRIPYVMLGVAMVLSAELVYQHLSAMMIAQDVPDDEPQAKPEKPKRKR